MAASWLRSSQYLHWQLSYTDLRRLRGRDLALLEPWEYKVVQIHLFGALRELAIRLQLRQQPIATAMVYMLRFYTRASLVETDPYIVIAACLYLACKVEECPQHIRTIAQECQKCWANSQSNVSKWQDGKAAGDAERIAEMEFYLIDEMETRLIVHHPYRVVDTVAQRIKLPGALHEHARMWCNEAYGCDIPLLFSPVVLAFAALCMAVCTDLGRIKDSKVAPDFGAAEQDAAMREIIKFMSEPSNGIRTPDVISCNQMLITHHHVDKAIAFGTAPIPPTDAIPSPLTGDWSARALLKRMQGEEMARIRKETLPNNLLNLARPSTRQQQSR
ncbi:cyclin-like protein [Protomyces lactucae-debilis]|uniref:Cyclin-like protein n=1 Tax=Protomyces lactucae-debilis TaxID=2754530 RepID=A0A1Y2FPT7_PROLT|nr:cyclin-like protein [Protomyces lactucae-debilis]ORY85617.1 cyclin-like protein [Protomyces lactucae-debilis]